MRATLPLLLALLAASPAAAEAMRIGDLGAAISRPACMTQARAALERYLDAHGGLSVTGEADSPADWAIYGWAMRPGSNDIVIMCPVVAGQANAFFTVHATGPEAVIDAETAASQLRAIWDALR